LLGSARALGCISNSLLRVLSLKGFLSGSLEQVTPMSLPLTTFAHSLPEIHMAPPLCCRTIYFEGRDGSVIRR